MNAVFGVCEKGLGPHHRGVHAKRLTCRRFESCDDIARRIEVQSQVEAGKRAKIDRERGIYPTLEEQNPRSHYPTYRFGEPRGACELDFELHPHYSLCTNWVQAPQRLDLQGNPTDVDWKKNLMEMFPFVPLTQSTVYASNGRTTTFKPVIQPEDYQKALREFRASMGNPLPPAAASSRPLSAVEAMQNNDAQQKSPDYVFRIDMSAVEDQVQNWGNVIGFCDNGPCAHEKCPSCKNWIAMQGYKVGEERRKDSGGYATLMTSGEILRAFHPEVFPEIDEEREARRQRDWDQFNWAVKQMTEDQKTQPMSATAAVAKQAEEDRKVFRVRVEARLDELAYVASMNWMVGLDGWYKRRKAELEDLLK
jgi:hypothetical protein